MAESNVRIRVRIGTNEVEVEAQPHTIRETIDLVPAIISHLPVQSSPQPPPDATPPLPNVAATSPANSTSRLPEIQLERNDSLTDIITKVFRESWGRQPRRLTQIRELLATYGLTYPKQSVAVALLRLAQTGKLRRFKGDTGEFVYTASTQLATEPVGIAVSTAVSVPTPST